MKNRRAKESEIHKPQSDISVIWFIQFKETTETLQTISCGIGCVYADIL